MSALRRRLRWGKESEGKKESQAKSTAWLKFFWRKDKKKGWSISSSTKAGSLDSPGEFCDAEWWMCLSWSLSFGGGTGEQESVPSQPGCQFSPNCRNLIPLGTSVPLSFLLKIDQQIQRSPGSVKHERISLISFGNWKKRTTTKHFLHNSK